MILYRRVRGLRSVESLKAIFNLFVSHQCGARTDDVRIVNTREENNGYDANNKDHRTSTGRYFDKSRFLSIFTWNSEL